MIQLSTSMPHREHVKGVIPPFTDLQLLVRNEFPAAVALCESRGVSFVEVDLRTGVTKEQSGSGQVASNSMLPPRPKAWWCGRS